MIYNQIVIVCSGNKSIHKYVQMESLRLIWIKVFHTKADLIVLIVEYLA